MMQENITDVALELMDYTRAAREAGETNSPDVDAAINRLFLAGGNTTEDALAILAYARLFLATMVNETKPEDEGGLEGVVFRCVHKAVTILENTTGKNAGEYI